MTIILLQRITSLISTEEINIIKYFKYLKKSDTSRFYIQGIQLFRILDGQNFFLSFRLEAGALIDIHTVLSHWQTSLILHFRHTLRSHVTRVG